MAKRMKLVSEQLFKHLMNIQDNYQNKLENSRDNIIKANLPDDIKNLLYQNYSRQIYKKQLYDENIPLLVKNKVEKNTIPPIIPPILNPPSPTNSSVPSYASTNVRSNADDDERSFVSGYLTPPGGSPQMSLDEGSPTIAVTPHRKIKKKIKKNIRFNAPDSAKRMRSKISMLDSALKAQNIVPTKMNEIKINGEILPGSNFKKVVRALALGRNDPNIDGLIEIKDIIKKAPKMTRSQRGYGKKFKWTRFN